jgi:hypothetical protein
LLQAHRPARFLAPHPSVDLLLNSHFEVRGEFVVQFAIHLFSSE